MGKYELIVDCLTFFIYGSIVITIAILCWKDIKNKIKKEKSC